MKKFFILLIVVLMLAGLTSTSFAVQNRNGKDNSDKICEITGVAPVQDRLGWK